MSEAGRMLPASPLCVYISAHITTVASADSNWLLFLNSPRPHEDANACVCGHFTKRLQNVMEETDCMLSENGYKYCRMVAKAVCVLNTASLLLTHQLIAVICSMFHWSSSGWCHKTHLKCGKFEDEPLLQDKFITLECANQNSFGRLHLPVLFLYLFFNLLF